MRACELRLIRGFRRLLLVALVAPAAGGVACAAASAAGSRDAGEADAGRCAPILVDGSALDNVGDGCAAFRVLPCGLPAEAQVDACMVDLQSCHASCGGPILFCQLAPGSCDDKGGALVDSSLLLECNSCPGSGRAPRGLRPRRAVGQGAGEHFAAMAYLEAASVRAFRDLEAWLRLHGAAPRLVRAARRAALDERRHARAASRLARRFGGDCERPRVRSSPTPSLREGLVDDAVAGCVGETYGALVTTWQSLHAKDARVRRTLRRIARDETRHAALSWEVLRWGLPMLGRRGRSRVRRALVAAIASLRAPVLDPEVRATVGHPTPVEHAFLVRGVARLVRRELPPSNAAATLLA